LKQDYLQIKMLEVAPQVYAAGQLFETDLQLISKQGARSIINTRPDNESGGQPLSADLAKVAGEYGITFVHFPVDPGPISQETATVFAKACDDLERPLIVCGRSGALSTRIWETAELAD
jgi:sulfide:quinone oxidoreductase